MIYNYLSNNYGLMKGMMVNMKKVELLAPAGSFEKAKTAFLYGADAVYCGTGSLSLRSRSEVNDNELAKTIQYAHSIGKKVYAAINIYAWDSYYDEIKNQAKMLNELKVDGIIASDGGVIDVIKKEAPDIDIHISTQANTVSYHSANFWHKNGAKRVILGRELNKEQIKEIIKNKEAGLEVEIFVHGAICFGYSGRCFLSDFLASRSANLGDCAQSCRWAYNVYVEENNETTVSGKGGLRVLSAGMNAKTEGKYGNSLSFSIPVIYPQNYFLLSEKTFEYFPDKDKGSDSGRYIYKDI